MLAFGIRTAAFAVGTRGVASGAISAGLFATLGIRCAVAGPAFGLCAIAARLIARCSIGTCGIAGLLAISGTIGFAAGFAVTRTIGIAGALTIARPVGFTTKFAITRATGFRSPFAIARGARLFASVAVARSKVAGADFTRRRSKAIARGNGRRGETLSAISLARSTGRRERRTITIATHGARQRRRHEFVHREFAVVVFVERAQRLGCAGDFVLGNHAIVIFVEGRDDGRYRRVLAATGSAGRTIW